MKQTTTATVLADAAANVPTTLVSYLQRLKALDETSASVSDKVHSEVESFVLALTKENKKRLRGIILQCRANSRDGVNRGVSSLEKVIRMCMFHST